MLRCGCLPGACYPGPDFGGLRAFVYRVHDCFFVAGALGEAPGAQGLVPLPLDGALEVSVVHGHA
eukprot:scaffold14060_cov61-Phaeocystis_antarctica.AAC.2